MNAKRIRLYKAVSNYPAFTHTSYNLEIKALSTSAEFSFHIRHKWGGGGFSFGIRPEFFIIRKEDKLRKLAKEMREAKIGCTCKKCGKKEWSEPGRGIPKGWDYIHMMEFCEECIKGNSYYKLMQL